MGKGKQVLYVLSVMAITILVGLAIFSACDNRRPISSTAARASDVKQITFVFEPAQVIVYDENEIDTVTVNIVVTDDEGVGIDGLDVNLSRTPNLGVVSKPVATTTSGCYQGKYITAPAGYGEIEFTASIGNVFAKDTLSVILQPVGVVEEISVSFNPQPLIINSPYKSDTALIDIWVRDANGVSLDSILVQISRTPAVGTIVPAGFTDMGYAQGMYITDPGVYQNVAITVSADGVSVTQTLVVTVHLLGEIGSMNISLQRQILVADGVDASNIYVSVMDTTGVPIGDGTFVFIQNYGPGTQGTLSETSGATENGIVLFSITSPPILNPDLIVERDSLRAWGISLSGDTTYAYSAVTYVPGEPASMNIYTIPEDMVAGSGESQVFEVLVTDENNNRVIDGTQVQFRNQLATSTITNITTTSGGIAMGVYVVGTEAGLDVIKAFKVTPGSPDTLWSNAVPLTVRSATGSNIALTASPTTIQVGGIAANVYATMQDENNNPLSDGFPVLFEIITHPGADSTRESPSFRYVPTNDSVLYAVVDSTDVNGRASVALFSGIRPGTVTIRATSVDNPNIFKQKPLVVIESGPPYNVEISRSGDPMPDGAVLVAAVSAVVSDSFTNPVECSTAVYFALIPDTLAEINGDAFTGGCIDTATGETLGTPGLAHTWLAYPCYNTFDTVRIITISGDLVDTSLLVALGLYEGVITCDANPGAIWLDDPGDADTSDIEAELIDGLLCPIEHGVINFTARNAGQIVEGMERDTTDEYGHAYSKFWIMYEQIPANPPQAPQITAEVVAKLRGYPDVEGSTEIFCSRPPG